MTPFDAWEDFTAGLYASRIDAAQVHAAAALLRDQDAFAQAAAEMLRAWPVAAVQNIQHMWSGRNAWVGQATCCYSIGATSAETRAAWGDLSNTDQRAANETARLVRAAWEKGHRDAQASLAV